jgi:hypothetical protein
MDKNKLAEDREIVDKPFKRKGDKQPFNEHEEI